MTRCVCTRSVSAIATTILVVLLFALGTPARERNPAAPGFPNVRLPSPARGSAALSALAAHLPQLAASYGKSTDELSSIFLRDHTIWTDTRGRLFYGCEFGPAPVHAPGAEDPDAVLEAPFPDDQTFLLHSRPGATKVIYLDFVGNVTSGTLWNSGGQDILSAPYDSDGIPSSFNTTELEQIQSIWQRVAEDYAPFEVDVTTEDPGAEALRKTDSTDTSYGVRVVISPTNWFSLNAGGVAYVGSFNWSSDLFYGIPQPTGTPCYVFTAQLGNYAKYIAEAASHEAGHTLGLSHDGVIGGSAYYYGQGNWAPIMGAGYYAEVTQWSKGEYPGANNIEDDLAIMTTYGISYRADDHGDSIGAATPLAGPNISAFGTIETRDDVDVFSFQTGAGSISFTVDPAPLGPNLDIYVALYDAAGNLVTSDDGAGMSASLKTAVTAGTYYLAIEGVGSGDPATTGYSDYDSLGQYQITGTVKPLRNQPPVAMAAATLTTGYAPLAVVFSSSGSYDPDGTIQSYSWNFGDDTASNSLNPSHTYDAPGSYTAVLTLTDNQGGKGTSSVTIRVQQKPDEVIFVSDISMSLVSGGGRQISARATITVKDASGAVRPGVTVRGQWSGLVTGGSSSDLTDATGSVTFTSKKTRNSGTFTFTVTKLSASGLVYDPSRNVETSDSISTPSHSGSRSVR